MSLFLKYRPQVFADLVGQEAVKRTLQNALKAEKPAHAYLFTGSRGTGKTSTARIFAKGLNCENLKEGDPCGTCRFCTGTADGSLVDVIEIDAASNRGIDEIRDLREKINFAPNLAKRKVYIIDEVHMMTKEAFNALLKTLEEPPDHAYFCLATTEIHKVPETIRSRCQTFSFQRFTLEQLADRLAYIAQQEGISTEPAALDLIARKAEGGLRDAISYLEQVAAETENTVTGESTRLSLGVSDSQTLKNLYQALQAQDRHNGLEILRSITHKGLDLRSFGHDFLAYLREQMLEQLQSDQLPFTLRCIEEIETALQRLKTSPIVELPLEIAVINLTLNSVQTSTPSIPTPPPAPSVVPASSTPSPTTTAAPVAPMPVPAAEPTPPSTADGFVFDGDPTPAPVPQTSATPAPTAAPMPVTPVDLSALTASSLKHQFETIAIKSGIPVFAKKSFLTSKPSVDGTIITLTTASEFHREKLDQTEVKNALLNTIQGLFSAEGFQIRIVKSGGSTPPPVAQEKASVDDFLDF